MLPNSETTLTQTGRLLYGVPFGGQTHHDFTMRAATMLDSIAVVSEMGAGPSPNDPGTDPKAIAADLVERNARIMIRQLTTLGDIPPEHITADYLLKNLAPEDFGVLWAADAALKKSWLALSDNGNNGQALSASSGNDSASPSTDP